VIDTAVFIPHGRLDCNAVGYLETHTIFADIRPEKEKKCCVLSLKNTYVFIFCGKKVINKEKEGFLFAVTLAKIISDD